MDLAVVWLGPVLCGVCVRADVECECELNEVWTREQLLACSMQPGVTRKRGAMTWCFALSVGKVISCD